MAVTLEQLSRATATNRVVVSVVYDGEVRIASGPERHASTESYRVCVFMGRCKEHTAQGTLWEYREEWIHPSLFWSRSVAQDEAQGLADKWGFLLRSKFWDGKVQLVSYLENEDE